MWLFFNLSAGLQWHNCTLLVVGSFFHWSYLEISRRSSQWLNPLSTRPHQNVVWYNNSWLGFLKNSELYTNRKRKIFCKKWALICHNSLLRWLIGIILGAIICKSSNWQHIQRLKITILGANWQLFRLEKSAKYSYFILSTQNIKFHWIVMKIKKFMLPIWWSNRDLFPLRNKYNVVFVLNELNALHNVMWLNCSTVRTYFLFIDYSWTSRVFQGNAGIYFLLIKVYLYPKNNFLYVKGTQFRSPLHQHSVKNIHQVIK